MQKTAMFLTDLDRDAFGGGRLGGRRRRLDVHEQRMVMVVDRLEELEVLLGVDYAAAPAAAGQRSDHLLVILGSLFTTDHLVPIGPSIGR